MTITAILAQLALGSAPQGSSQVGSGDSRAHLSSASIDVLMDRLRTEVFSIADRPAKYLDLAKAAQQLDPIMDALDQKLKAALNRDDTLHDIFKLASRLFSYRKGNRALNENLAGLVVSRFHTHVDPMAEQTLDENFSLANSMLTGTPYAHGYVSTDGSIQLERRLAGIRQDRATQGIPFDPSFGYPRTYLGLNCITMNHVMSHLVVGADSFTPDTPGTNETLYEKVEYRDMGLYSFPVIERLPAPETVHVTPLLKMYGKYFTAQLYTDDTPVHTVFIYERDGQYYVLDTLSNGGGFREVGEIGAVFRNHIIGSLTFNLLDTNLAQPADRANADTFLQNLGASVEQSKKEYRQYQELE